jgi:phosphoribosylformylglycinamidine synthase
VATGPASSSSKSGERTVLQLFRRPFLSEEAAATLTRKANLKPGVDGGVASVTTEQCFNVETTEPLTSEEMTTLQWLLRETFEPELFTEASAFADASSVVEVGPRLAFQSAWSTNAVGVCKNCGLEKVTRLERSRRFLVTMKDGSALTDPVKLAFASIVHDRMTECVYDEPLATFATDASPEEVYTVPVLAEGRAALERVDKEMGLAFDEEDFDYYLTLFRDDIGRDPTNVELFDMGQSNSEHSRHWFFGGNLIVDGVPQPESLFKMVKDTIAGERGHNSVIAFKDNSSAIRGYVNTPLRPVNPGGPSALEPRAVDLDLLLTAETHNFPSGVAPYPGAETGAGGRMRDTHATGIGSLLTAGTAGYCVGNLRMEGNAMPFESETEVKDFKYPSNLADPLRILVDASNGASDYGNKFGEPLIAGYCRSFGQRLKNGERREWIKPIMFSGGFGQIDHTNLEKTEGDVGMLVVKIGGPAYRIGMGGGAASSKAGGEDEANADLDFNAVQRGDAEMSNKLNRVVKACVELEGKNPILSIHDQGAGGNCNVCKELIYPKGGELNIREVKLGDATLSVLEIWGAEYQENSAMLIAPESLPLIEKICARERCPFSVLGAIDGSGRVKLIDPNAPPGSPTPEDLDLEKVLGDMPRKTYDLTRMAFPNDAVSLPTDATAPSALDRVLRLPSVCSKRFLTTKVDRSVTGLVAQQQCVGPLQVPVADVAVIAQTHYGITGGATCIGEQPIKGMVDPAAMARMSLGESLTNLVFANTTGLRDVKYSGNWMYAAKLPGDGAHMFDACKALCEAMGALDVAIDGGKDSLSMAARADGEVVKAPGSVVMSGYVTVPDVTKTVTPDLKTPGASHILLVEFGSSEGKRRLGGSALAQAYGQMGDVAPDMDDVAYFKAAWEATQTLVADRKIAAGHDVSDGGFVTAVLEMAFPHPTAGIDVTLPTTGNDGDWTSALFAEELALFLEVSQENLDHVLATYAAAGVTVSDVGSSTSDGRAVVRAGDDVVVDAAVADLRDTWEATSFALERLQSSEATVAAEEASLRLRAAPAWHLTYAPERTSDAVMSKTDKVRVAILREEGSNGDREMAAAIHSAGMEPWDVTMSDLLNGAVKLEDFRGLVFVGGFSYADVLDSAKGWAGSIKFNESLWSQFRSFYDRKDTFSLGVCNGCQLMALLGFVPAEDGLESLPDAEQPRFIHNDSGRFESRWVTVGIDENTPAVMLQGMQGSRLGVWIAHGEGKVKFPDASRMAPVIESGCAPIKYVDSNGDATEAYPLNPNGSPMGVAGLCSKDGRHLAMMPHPERAFLGWQMPWFPADSGLTAEGPGPWLRMFQNARVWAEKQ